MAKSDILNYVVNVCNTDCSGIDTYFVNGTYDDIKKFVHQLATAIVEEFRDNDPEGYKSIKDLQIEGDTIAAYPYFNDYHVDIYARPVEESVALPLDPKTFEDATGWCPVRKTFK